jgi:hypothetical protein
MYVRRNSSCPVHCATSGLKLNFPQFNECLGIFRNLYFVLRHVELSIEKAYILLARSIVITINLFLLFWVTFSIDEYEC